MPIFDFQQLLSNSGVSGSMSRKGNSYDNAMVKSFFAKLKTDRVGMCLYQGIEGAKRDIVDCIEMFYNLSGLHSLLDYVSPKDLEGQ